MSQFPDLTPEAVHEALGASGFAAYNPDDPSPEGFLVGRAAIGPAIMVELRGLDLPSFNPGEGPRELLDKYVQALDLLGYSVRLASTTVVVAGIKP